MVCDGGDTYGFCGERHRRLTAPECSLLLLQEIFRAAMRREEVPSLKWTGRWHILKGEPRWGEAPPCGVSEGNPSPFFYPPRKGPLDRGQRERQGVTDKPTTSEPLPLFA